jgi:hypothetical protein
MLLEVDVSPRGSSLSLMGAEPREPVEGPDDVAESGWLLQGESSSDPEADALLSVQRRTLDGELNSSPFLLISSAFSSPFSPACW